MPEVGTLGRRPAAVLIPIYDGAAGPTLLFIRRTLGGHHSGQVAFPGGRPEPSDGSLEETALREAEEELAIPRTAVRVLGALPAVETVISNYVIHPYVGRLGDRPRLELQRDEVAAVLDVPFAILTRPPLEDWWDLPPTGDGANGQRRLVRYYPWEVDRIWGATQRMIELLVLAVARGTIVL